MKGENHQQTYLRHDYYYYYDDYYHYYSNCYSASQTVTIAVKYCRADAAQSDGQTELPASEGEDQRVVLARQTHLPRRPSTTQRSSLSLYSMEQSRSIHAASNGDVGSYNNRVDAR